MLMSKVNKGGRPKEEPTSVRSVRFSNKLWKMIGLAAKSNRSINEYFLELVENDLIGRKIMKQSDRKNLIRKR